MCVPGWARRECARLQPQGTRRKSDCARLLQHHAEKEVFGDRFSYQSEAGCGLRLRRRGRCRPPRPCQRARPAPVGAAF